MHTHSPPLLLDPSSATVLDDPTGEIQRSEIGGSPRCGGGSGGGGGGGGGGVESVMGEERKSPKMENLFHPSDQKGRGGGGFSLSKAGLG